MQPASAMGIRNVRPAGLGNLLIPWAKAWIGHKALGLRYAEPPWALSRRRYDRDFQSGRIRPIASNLAASFRSVTVTEEMYRSTTMDDYGNALRRLADTGVIPRDRNVLHEGMWGGYLAVRSALPYLRTKLLLNAYARMTPQQITPPNEVNVVLHVRLGDFSEAAGGPAPGTFNTSVPLSWYEGIVASLVEGLGPGQARVTVVTDSPKELRARSALLAGFLPDANGTVLTDLASMLSCDFLVCSVSSLSMFAAAASDSSYAWYAPHLGETRRMLSIWGHEPAQAHGGPTDRAVDVESRTTSPSRAVAVGRDGCLPSELLHHLSEKAEMRRQSADLVFYGVRPNGGGHVA